jgi:excisionase family DNA binding protein
MLPDNNHLLSIQQAAERLGVSTKTLRRWENRGLITPQRTVGNQRRYTLEQVENFRKTPPMKPKPSLGSFQINPQQGPALVPLGLPLGFLKLLFLSLLIMKLSLVVGSPSPAKPASLTQRLTEAGWGGKTSPLPVLGLEEGVPDFVFSVNVPANFAQDLEVQGDLTAPNILYSVKAGSGVSVSSGQTPTIANTGVLSLGGSTGALSLAAGSGISVSGLTITNSDLGSSQYIFKKIAVSGQTTIESDANDDTLTFVNGSGITITTDATDDNITITASGSDLNVSGWTDDGTTVRLSTSTDSVGIGTTSPAYKLEVNGTLGVGSTAYFASLVGIGTTAPAYTLDVAGTSHFSSNLSLASEISILPVVDLGADLGSATNRFNNIYVGNINSNAGLSTAGQALFTYSPADTTYAESSVMINPTTALENSILFGIGVGGTKYQRAGIDAEGDLSLGYSGDVTIPSSGYPLNIYGHAATRVAYIDTAGNTSLAGSVGIGTSSPASKLSVAGGVGIGTTSPTSVYHSTAIAPDGGLIVEGNVGIGTTLPSAALHLVSTATTGYGEYLVANSLTTGAGLYLSSTSTALTTGNLLKIDWSPTTTTTATGDLFAVGIGSSANIGNILNVTDTGSSLFSVSETTVTSNLPASFTAAGDVSIAYDLVFTNQTASYIKSNGPFTLEAGESFENNDITLKTYGVGGAVFDTPGGLTLTQAQAWTLGVGATSPQALNIQSGLLDLDTTNTRVGIGTTAPAASLDVASTAWLRGTGTSGLYVNSSGSVGIGTTSPGEPLEVYRPTGNTNLKISAVGPGGVNSSLTLNASTTGGNLASLTYNSWVDNLVFNNSFTGADSIGGHFIFNTRNGLERMRITNAGNVGIGTTTPSSKLSIAGGVGIGTTSPTSVYHSTAIAPDGGLIVEGRVGIGTTSPSAKLSFAADTVAAGGIDFGGDVNLYRSAADTLATSDTLSIGTWIWFS